MAKQQNKDFDLDFTWDTFASGGKQNSLCSLH